MMATRRIKVEALVDGHVHLREGEELARALVRASIDGGADVIGAMPNTTDPLNTLPKIERYMDMVTGGLPDTVQIFPYLMLTERTTTAEIERCFDTGVWHTKVYPLGRTTNSDFGVMSYAKILNLVRYCGELGMVCHFHPENPDLDIMGRDAEYLFLPIIEMFMQETEARLVWEHATDMRCVPQWKRWAKEERFFVTITPHHLLATEDSAYGDVAAVCKPPIKTIFDRAALVQLVSEDHPWVMAGTDSAYHPIESKHTVGPCKCGDFTAPWALPLYAHALEPLLVTEYGIETFINFTSQNPRQFLPPGLPAARTVVLVNEPQKIADRFELAPGHVALPFWGGKTINWQILRN